MKQKKISQLMQRWLLLCVLLAFAATTALTYFLQTSLSQSNTLSLLTLNIEDVRQDITDASDENLLSIAYAVAERLGDTNAVGKKTLNSYAEEFDVIEINVINEDGVIIATTHDNFMNYGMRSGEQSAEFMVLLEGVESYVQSYGPTSGDASLSRKYAGVALESGGFVQVGYDFEQFRGAIDSQVVGVTRNRRIGENGCIIVADENGYIVSSRNKNEGEQLLRAGIDLEGKNIPEWTVFEADVYGEPSYCMYTVNEGYYIISVMRASEVTLSRDLAVKTSTIMEVAIMAILFVMIYVLIKRLVVDNIHKINGTLAEITDGNLDVSVDVHSSEEFSALSDDINDTVGVLKRYISEAEARIDAELEVARAIQSSSLPSVFPPYPLRRDFDIYASMNAAKEVGGDFYDFYLVDDDTLAFIVADVSGKGIPAAMFMMTAKAMLKSCAESGMAVNDVFTTVNQKLCEGNEAEMFVTAWMGVLDLKTGKMNIANAGHNPPLVCRKDGSFEFFKVRPGLVLGGMEGIRYRCGELQLQPGDEIFLYTDGVTEATNPSQELFGDDRLQELLNANRSAGVEELCRLVKAGVDTFADGEAQFDDITMLALKYKGEAEMKELNLEATLENVETVTRFVEEQLEAVGCPIKAQMQINIAIDELFSNIARYAYNPETGPATVRVEVMKEPMEVVITFIDNGVPYDPLSREDPDTTLSAEERDIGGLGIFLVKKNMDEVAYEYKNGQNILRIRKDLGKKD